MNPRQAAFAALVAKRESLAKRKPKPCRSETLAFDDAMADGVRRLKHLQKLRDMLAARRRSTTGRLDRSITHNIGLDVQDALFAYWRALAAAEAALADLCACQKRKASVVTATTGPNE